MNRKSRTPKKRTLPHPKVNRTSKELVLKRLSDLKDQHHTTSLVYKHLQERYARLK